MKISDIKATLILGLALTFAPTLPAEAQGLFNRKKKPADLSNAGNLFPDASAPGYVTSSAPSAPQDLAIFKDGQPQEVTETSYFVRDGEKIEKKRRSFFGMRKNKTPESADAPPSSYSNETPTFSPPSSTPAPSTIEPLVSTPAPAVPVAKREKRFGLPNLSLPTLPLFRKHDEDPIDTRGAEILVNNGGTLAPADSDTSEDYRFETRKTTSSSSKTKEPPRSENGSIVYNSWADVSAKKTSAADQIVRDIKSQEAANEAKIAAAKREYEEKIKKAEADARIRAIMQGGTPGL